MKKDDVRVRDESLTQLLKELSYNVNLDDKNKYEYFVNKLRNIYYVKDIDGSVKEIYRHSYSKMFAVLQDIARSDDIDSDLPVLQQNLDVIYFRIQESNETRDFRLAVYKLFDHINLDIARIQYLQSENKKYYDTIIYKYSNLKKDCDKSIAEFNKTENNIKNSQEKLRVDMFAILSVFAAIIIACVSSIAFSSQLLSNIIHIPTDRFMIAASLCGFVTVVIFYMVYMIVERIVFKSKRNSKPAIEQIRNIQKWSLQDWIVPAIMTVLLLTFTIGLFWPAEKQSKEEQKVNISNPATVNQFFNTSDPPRH